MHYAAPAYRPNRKQALFHASPAAYKMFLGGVGSGKTHAGVREMVLSALDNGPGHRYFVGAPSEKILREATFDAYRRFFREFHAATGRRLERKVLTSPSNRAIILPGDIVFSFVNLKDPDNLAGPTITGFHLDEGALLADGMGAWNMLLERHRGGTVGSVRRFGIVTTTPRGPVGVVEHFRAMCDWQEKQGMCGPARDREYDMVASATWENVAHLGISYIRRMLAGKSERQIQQQIYAQVLDYVGAVYSGEFSPIPAPDGRSSVALGWTPQNLHDPDEPCEIYLAIDWGPLYPHVLWIAHYPEQDIDVVFGELVDDGLHTLELLEAAVAHGKAEWGLDRWDYQGVYCDPNPGSAVLKARVFWRQPKSEPQRRKKSASWVPVHAYRRLIDRDHFVTEGIEVVAARLLDAAGKRRLFFAPQLLESRAQRRITQCMRLYSWKERTADSETVFDDLRPVKGMYDHGPDALRYYCGPRYYAQVLRLGRPGEAQHKKAA